MVDRRRFLKVGALSLAALAFRSFIPGRYPTPPGEYVFSGMTRRTYELVGVPWVTFFHPAGIAFHGTYWHDNFGTPMSQGCCCTAAENSLSKISLEKK